MKICIKFWFQWVPPPNQFNSLHVYGKWDNWCHYSSCQTNRNPRHKGWFFSKKIKIFQYFTIATLECDKRCSYIFFFGKNSCKLLSLLSCLQILNKTYNRSLTNRRRYEIMLIVILKLWKLNKVKIDECFFQIEYFPRNAGIWIKDL